MLHDILKAGANINHQDEFGKTPLHLAVEKGEPVIGNMLMKTGVNALTPDNEGVRAGKTKGKSYMAPHTLQFKVLMYETQQEKLGGTK